MNARQFWGTLTCAWLALCGCGGSSVRPIGGGPSAGSGGAGDSPGGAPAGVGASSGTGSTNSGPLAVQLAGTWTGYVENFKFVDQSDALKLVLRSDQTGEITFGNSPEPGPASDPNVGYPEREADTSEPHRGLPYGNPVPGFTYTLRNVSEEGSRLQFEVVLNDVWAEWCLLQTPIPVDGADDYYLCASSWPSLIVDSTCKLNNPNNGQEWITVDCGKLLLCTLQYACDCTAKGCKVTEGSSAHFDLNLALPRANGTVVGFDAQPHNIHLTKQ